MAKKVKLTLFDFIHEDLFELNSYVSYLFNPFTITVPDRLETRLEEERVV